MLGLIQWIQESKLILIKLIIQLDLQVYYQQIIANKKKKNNQYYTIVDIGDTLESLDLDSVMKIDEDTLEQ